MRTRMVNKKGVSAVNTAGLAVAVLLFGYSLVLVPPAALVQDAQHSLAAAAVSISAGVPANPDNTLAQQLQEKAAQLDAQQQHIQQLEQSLGGSDQLALYSLLASLVLLLLVAANFYFDWRRSRSTGGALTRALSVDLRTLRQR